ncbi:transposase [Athalassotoga sp.]|uniref:transposase n=1 Tax=Athalassotoga sp. TaxID=2022597 RepID=UPI003D00399D
MDKRELNYICHDVKTGFIRKISKYVEGLSESEFECVEINDEKIYVHEVVVEIQDFRFPMKIVVCKDESGRQIVLVSTDISMSGIEIVSTYLERWDIETYFKSAKQEFNLGKCKLRTESGQRHWMILIKISYLIFKEHMEYVKKDMEVVSKQDVFNIIQNALSCLSSDQSNVKSDYNLLEINFEIKDAT